MTAALPSDREWTLIHALRARARTRDELLDAPETPVRNARLSVTFASSGGVTVSAAELDRRSDRLAAGLANLGVGPEDRVALMARNRVEFVVTVLAAHKRRAVVVPLNVELRGALLAHQLETSDPVVLVAEASLMPAVDALAPHITRDLQTILIDGPVDGAEALAFKAVASAPLDPEAVLLPEPEDIAALLFTSGTTGPAKGVLMPHAHCFLFGYLQARATSTTAEDTVLIALPMFHVNALFMALGSCLLTGADAYVLERFSATSWLEDVRTSRATVTNMVGVMAEFISSQPVLPDDREHCLRRVMSIPASAVWGAEFEARFGVRLVQVYGMTECNVVSFSDPKDALEPGCTGPVVAEFFEAAIVDEGSDRPLAPGRVGEIVVRPRRAGCFMAGYFGAAEQTVEAWRNLWFHTGDAGFLDERGRLHYVDRLKDCLRRRGENISAFEVEQVINQHPWVAESAVVGIRTAGSGGEDEIKACVVPDGDLEIDVATLRAWLETALPRFAVPRFVEILPRLDKTATGKVQKDGLRRSGVTATTVDCLAGIER